MNILLERVFFVASWKEIIMRPIRTGLRRGHHLVWWGGALMAFLVSAPLSARGEDAAAVLARMRAAAGTKVLAATREEVLLQGKLNEHESAGEYRLRFTAGGKFLETKGGPLGSTFGFNGTTCWMVDRTGVSRTVELFDRDLRQLWVGLQTGQWLANVAPAAIALAAEGSDKGVIVLDILQGRLKGKLHVNRTTWLPESLTYKGVGGLQTWTFTAYRDDFGWKLPGKVVVKLPAGITHTYEVQSVARAPAAGTDVFAPVKSVPTDVRFRPDLSPRLEVKRTKTGHILVHPKIDGMDLGWLIFDTGAGSSTVLHRDALARLKLSPIGAAPLTSFLGSTRSSIYRGKTLEIGPMTLTRPFLVEMDLGFVQKALGDEVVGIIGYDLLSRCVAEVTLEDDTIKIYDPERYHLESAPWQRLIFNQWVPLVPATFDGGKGLFRIDVGAAGGPFSNVVFHAPAVEALHLLEHRKTTTTTVGPTRVAIGKIGWFEIAGHRFEGPDAVFALDHQGPLGDAYLEGNLGVAFLRPFRIVLDYRNERLAFLDRSKRPS
jgi:hypothetical protein